MRKVSAGPPIVGLVVLWIGSESRNDELAAHVSFLRTTGATGTKEAEKIRSHRILDR